jgi:hypothetical protein
LRDKLSDLVKELERRRLNLGKAMLVLSVVMANLAGATTIAADGPVAVTHIMRLIGVDKESEEAALSRLAPPPKALPAPEKQPVAPRKCTPAWDTPTKGDLDDEIPF